MVDDVTQTDAPAEHRFLRLTEEEAEMLLSRSWRPNVELCTRGRILRIIAKKVRNMPPLLQYAAPSLHPKWRQTGRKENFTTKLPRTTLGTRLARTGTNSKERILQKKKPS